MSTPFDGAKLGSVIVLMVREYVARQMDGVGQSVTKLAERIATLENRAPVPGPKGEDGRDGKDAEIELQEFVKAFTEGLEQV